MNVHQNPSFGIKLLFQGKCEINLICRNFLIKRFRTLVVQIQKKAGACEKLYFFGVPQTRVMLRTLSF